LTTSPEGPGANLDYRWRLAALELSAGQQGFDLAPKLGCDVSHRCAFEKFLEQIVEDLVGRQRILVALSRRELGRWRLVDDRRRNRTTEALVDPTRQPVDVGLKKIANQADAAVGTFYFTSGGSHTPTAERFSPWPTSSPTAIPRNRLHNNQ